MKIKQQKQRWWFGLMIVGILAFIIAGSSVVKATANEIPQQKPETLRQWLSTLDQSQHEQFYRLMNENFKCFLQRDENTGQSFNQQNEIFLNQLQQILPAEKVESFKSLWKTKRVNPTKESLSKVTDETCGSCYWVSYWTEHGINYIADAQYIYSTSTHHCDTTPWGVPMQPVEAGLFLSNLYGNQALDNLEDAYNTCDCESAQDALENLQDALQAVQNTIDDTNYWCDPDAPWLDMLSEAARMFSIALQSVQSCIDEACGS